MPEQRKQPGAVAAPAKADKPSRPCPICGKPAEHAFRPFCSPRCRDVDLNRWLSGRYVVPGREDPAEEE
ncbi:DNA gyrase inhibitor YacG [Bradyrhizobium cenepequi]